MRKTALTLVILSLICVIGFARKGIALGSEGAEGDFRIDTALAVRMCERARDYGDIMHNFADSIAALHGGRITPANYKTLKSTLRKCGQRKVQADQLNDLVRCMIACPYDSLHAMIADLVDTAKKKGIFKNYKHQEYSSRGYWGDMVILDHGVMGSEIQVKSFYMAYANFEGDVKAFLGDSICAGIRKETGMEPCLSHHYYEIIRDVTGRYSDYEKTKAKELNVIYLKTFWEDYEEGMTFYE